ncbi:polyketide synthase protein [Colletotrichum incanum]|nr:polyketide synthase protein [Colletotrichum incanum]
MACRFPRSDNLDEFWQLLCNGQTAFRTMPQDRFDPSKLTREPKLANFWGNFLDSPDAFDHKFFGISGREAKSMDPQQRLVLQVAYEALESAGYCSTPMTKNVGCYLGVGNVDYDANVAARDANAFAATGTLRAFISGRVSHFFGWDGPSLTIDTACSSSAVAIHTARKALLTGECSVALAGGVNIITSPALHQNLAAGSFLNTSGSSRAFDNAAAGYCRGEGAGMVILKPLSKALIDNDRVFGVLASTAVNQNSNCSPITVPHSSSQSALYQRVLDDAGIKPQDVTYVEAHGTGTKVGDPIEYESVRTTFSGPLRTQPIFIGSVKDNIGHAEAASGAAAVIKALLMMQHRMIPKQANFTLLNRNIQEVPRDNLIVPKSTIPWTAEKRVALVNNYGAAGSNAALLIREYTTETPECAEPPSTVYPILLSAKSEISLNSNAEALKRFLLKQNISLGSVAYNVAVAHNSAFDRRIGFCANGCESASSTLERLSSTTVNARKPVVLCFGGQNGRTVSVSKELYNHCDLFKSHLDKCDNVCRTLGFSIFPDIFRGDTTQDTVILHCMLLSLQLSCAMSWIDSGLEIDTLVGHSFGQLTALCIAGSIGLEDTFRLVAGRARLIRDTQIPDRGVMMAVECDRVELDEMVTRVNSKRGFQVDVACYNGPRSFVVAGDAASISEAAEGCRSFKTVKLQNDHAYHSYLTDGILQDLRKLAESINIQPPRIRVETCTASASWSQFGPEEIVQHTRQPVYFDQALGRISARLPSAVWLEAGSTTPIIPMARRVVAAHNRFDTFIPMQLDANVDAMAQLAKVTCDLWNSGLATQYWLFHRSSGYRYRKLNLPPYQFEKSSHWLPFISAPTTDALEANTVPGLVKLIPNDESTPGEHVLEVNTQGPMFQLAARGHAVTGQSICPASMFVEMVAQSTNIVSKRSEATMNLPSLRDLTMSAPLGIGNSLVTIIRLRETGQDAWDFAILSQTSVSDCHGAIQHASGCFAWKRADDHAATKRLQLLGRLGSSQLKASSMTAGISGAMVYKWFGEVVEYADYYRGVQNVAATENKAVGQVKLPLQRPLLMDAGICDPITLDNFLQVAGIHCNCLSERDKSTVLMCTSVDEVVFSTTFLKDQSNAREWMVYTRFEEDSPKTRTNDIFVCEAKSGDIVMAIIGANFRSVPFKSLAKSLTRLNGVVGATTTTTTPVIPTPLGDMDDVPDSGYSTEPASQGSDDGKAQSPQEEGVNGFENPLPGLGKLVPQAPETSADVLWKVRTLLSEIIEIPVEEVTPSTTLEVLGIDSLLVTEVLAEVLTQIGVQISQEQFAECVDVRDIAALVRGTGTMDEGREFTDDAARKVPVSSTLAVGAQPNSAAMPAGPAVASLTDCHSTKEMPNLASIGFDAFAKSIISYDKHAETTGFANFYANVFPTQSELVVQYILTAFAKLGCDLQLLTHGDFLPTFDYQQKHAKVVTQLYEILVTAGLATKAQDGRYRRTQQPLPTTSISALMERLMQQFPQHVSEMKLLHSTAHKLAECLTGQANPVSLIFQDSAARALLADVYTNAPMFKTGTLQLTEYLTSVLSRLGGKRELKILELGAGTGGTTKHVVETLDKISHGANFTYTFTDLSSSLVAAARRKFAHWTFMEYKVVDIEKDTEPELLGAYDIILSTNCIHATRDLVLSTTNIRKMLKPDGLLCLVELTRNLYWFDLVFGLLEGWWLFADGRQHALASEDRWEQALQKSGFEWVDWSRSSTKESELLRVITASAYNPSIAGSGEGRKLVQTLPFKEVDGVQLNADIYYPAEMVDPGKKLPVVLMIHGGGHIMLSRQDIRPDQTNMLLKSGFLPVSVDYRLCPEVTLSEGPMADVADALHWVRTVLPKLSLARHDIVIDDTKVVVVGWSTGGHLAMTLAWTSIARQIAPPNAILTFYCPSDYEDEFWMRPNVPKGASSEQADPYHLDDRIWNGGVFDSPIVKYNVAPAKRALGGWMASSDPRSRLALHMNCQGHTLHVLLNGLDKKTQRSPATPTNNQIISVSPLAQIRAGNYATPTFIIHPRDDDLIPWRQAERTWQALCDRQVDAELRILDGVPHLFDMTRSRNLENTSRRAVIEGYEFLCRHAGLVLRS